MSRTIFGAVLLFVLLSSPFAQAATLYMSPQDITLNRADSATISVRLDVDDGECINAIDGVITFPESIIPVDISRGRSILSLWVENPTIDIDKQTITFAGGIPNGYCGRIAGDPQLTNNVIDIVVQSPSFVVGGGGDAGATTTTARLDFAPETQILLNDNYGTRVDARLYGTDITLTKRAGQGTSDWLEVVAADNTPPSPFALTLNRTPNAFSNRYFITFNTTDKQSGIDRYEVIEESFDDLPFINFDWARQDAPWVEVESPYVIKDQSLNSVIRVRAIDKAGNEYVASLTPEEEVRTMSQQSKVLLVIIGVAVVLFVMVMLVVVWLVTRRRKTDIDTEDHTDTESDELDEYDEEEAEREELEEECEAEDESEDDETDVAKQS